MPQFRLPDADSTAHIVLTQALAFCADKMGLASGQDALARMQGELRTRTGDGCTRKYCHYSVAKQVAASLGALDDHVKAAYVIEYDATPEDLCFGQETPGLPIHLILWAERKTKALDALIASLDHALTGRYAEMLGLHRLAHVLDVQVVDDADVENRVGYGAMLSSLHQQPIQIWKR
jgi:hypothetical protein